MVIKLFFSVLWIGFCVTFAILFQALLWPLITLGFLLKAIPYRKVKAFLLWLAWDGSGARAIVEHLRPPTEEEKKSKRPAATFMLWFAGIYTALFGIAIARYENATDRLELRASSVISLLSNDRVRPQACSQIAGVQERTVPFKPEILSPGSIIKSFDPRQETEYQESIDMLVKAVESCKDSLEKANLPAAILHGAGLWYARLQGANLTDAELQGADLSYAELQGAYLSYAILHDAYLGSAELHDASLWFAELHGASMFEAKLHDANLGNAELHGASLSEAELYGSDLEYAKLHGTSLWYADFTCVNLNEADLEDVQDWETANFTNCNIKDIRNAPEGFREWAQWNGAVEMDWYEWKQYLLGK